MSPLLILPISVVVLLHGITFFFIWKDNRLEKKHKVIATVACLLLPIIANLVGLVIFSMATDEKKKG